MSDEARRLEEIQALARLQGIELSAERATALARRLAEYQGAVERLRAEGFGQSDPALDYQPSV